VGSGAAFLQDGELVRVLEAPAAQPAPQEAPAEGIRGREG
jgi:hypothetical protein